MNLRLASTWARMKVEGGPTALNAVRKTGIHPLNPHSENHTDGLDLVSRKYQLGLAWRDNADEYNPDWQKATEGPQYKLITARQSAPNRAILIRAKAAEYVETSHVVPAQQLRLELEKIKRAKQNKVVTKPDRMNPDTTYGLAVVEGVLQHAEEVQMNRDTAADAAATKKLQGEERRVARRQKKSASFDEVVLAVSIGRHFDWAKLAGRGGAVKSDVLNLALQEWVREPKYTKKLKAGEVARDFQHRFRSMLVAIVVSAVSMGNANSIYWVKILGIDN